MDIMWIHGKSEKKLLFAYKSVELWTEWLVQWTTDVCSVSCDDQLKSKCDETMLIQSKCPVQSMKSGISDTVAQPGQPDQRKNVPKIKRLMLNRFRMWKNSKFE